MNQDFCLNQLRAGGAVARATKSFFESHPGNVTGLESLRDKDSKALARRICLATVSCSVVNCFRGYRVFDEEGEGLTVGDFFKVVLPWHKVEATGLSRPYDMGWRVMDLSGNVYHHVVIAFLDIFGIRTYSLHDFSGVEWLRENLIGREVLVALSLDNSFVLEQTLSQEDRDYLRRFYPDFGRQKGRHMVLPLGFEEEAALLVDPFRVLKPEEKAEATKLDFQSINKYFHYQFPGPTQALVFSLEEINFPGEYLKNVFIPDYVRKDIKFLKKRFSETKTL